MVQNNLQDSQNSFDDAWRRTSNINYEFVILRFDRTKIFCLEIVQNNFCIPNFSGNEICYLPMLYVRFFKLKDKFSDFILKAS